MAQIEEFENKFINNDNIKITYDYKKCDLNEINNIYKDEINKNDLIKYKNCNSNNLSDKKFQLSK